MLPRSTANKMTTEELREVALLHVCAYVIVWRFNPHIIDDVDPLNSALFVRWRPEGPDLINVHHALNVKDTSFGGTPELRRLLRAMKQNMDFPTNSRRFFRMAYKLYKVNDNSPTRATLRLMENIHVISRYQTELLMVRIVQRLRRLRCTMSQQVEQLLTLMNDTLGVESYATLSHRPTAFDYFKLRESKEERPEFLSEFPVPPMIQKQPESLIFAYRAVKESVEFIIDTIDMDFCETDQPVSDREKRIMEQGEFWLAYGDPRFDAETMPESINTKEKMSVAMKRFHPEGKNLLRVEALNENRKRADYLFDVNTLEAIDREHGELVRRVNTHKELCENVRSQVHYKNVISKSLTPPDSLLALFLAGRKVEYQIQVEAEMAAYEHRKKQDAARLVESAKEAEKKKIKAEADARENRILQFMHSLHEQWREERYAIIEAIENQTPNTVYISQQVEEYDPYDGLPDEMRATLQGWDNRVRKIDNLVGSAVGLYAGHRIAKALRE